MESAYTILVVEGKKPTNEYLAPGLDGDYNIFRARTRREALAQVEKDPPAVIVLDAPSLRFSCKRFCETLEHDGVDIPVLMLFAKGKEDNPDVGASAYLQYPFSSQKLSNRISWLLPVPEGEVLQLGDLSFNVKRHSVVCGDRETHLTPKQSRLLEVFMRHPGEVLTRSFLMKHVWETDYTDDTRTLDVHIHWVRKAIEEDTRSPVYLRTVRGVGYRFEVPRREGRQDNEGR